MKSHFAFCLGKTFLVHMVQYVVLQSAALGSHLLFRIVQNYAR